VIRADDRGGPKLLEAVVNLSEGRDPTSLAALRAAGGRILLDLHADVDHNRAVLTLAGDDDEVLAAVEAVAGLAVALLDIRHHVGAHPRLGVIDVVPFVEVSQDRSGRLRDAPPHGIGSLALTARDRFARRAGRAWDLPCFLYGPPSSLGGGRTLPEIRRRAWTDLAPEAGPPRAHPSAGAACVGARPLLVAYNLWLADADLPLARRVATRLRQPGLRTLGLAVGDAVQVSCNLVDPFALGPAEVFDAVAALAAVQRAELVGLLPAAVLDRVPARRWPELGLASSATIEARLEEAGLDGGRLGGRARRDQ